MSIRSIDRANAPIVPQLVVILTVVLIVVADQLQQVPALSQMRATRVGMFTVAIITVAIVVSALTLIMYRRHVEVSK